MKTRLTLLAALAAAFPLFSALATGQGALAPSGAPAPMMKTLDQLEARTPLGTPGSVATSTLTINTPGSYVLMCPVTVAAGDGIVVNCGDVTLDLNGFTIASTLAAGPSGSGINVTASAGNITLRNGHIRSGTTYGGSVYATKGFAYGIQASSVTGNTLVEDMTFEGIGSYGIYGQYAIPGCTVRNCQVRVCGVSGIMAFDILDSQAVTCGSTAIWGAKVTGCEGVCTATEAGIRATVAINSRGTSVAYYGLMATERAFACSGYSQSYIAFSATRADFCEGITTSGGTGLQATHASNCHGACSSGAGTGLSATTAVSCQGESAGGVGISATESAIDCRGTSTSGVGISTAVAKGCRGKTSTGSAALSTGIAEACYGLSLGSGKGISATTAHACMGYSDSGTGVDAMAIAADCYGQSSSGTGLGCFGHARGCYGSSNSGTGINAGAATDCYARTTASGSFALIVAGTATSCRASAPNNAIYAAIAIGCTTESGSISVTNHYDMPP